MDSLPLDSLVSYGVSLYSSQFTEVQDDNEEVVPNTPSLLSSDQHEEFLHSFNALEERDDYGIGLYTSARETLSRIISTNRIHFTFTFSFIVLATVSILLLST